MATYSAGEKYAKPSIQGYLLLLVAILLVALLASAAYETWGDLSHDTNVTRREATRVAEATAARAENFLQRTERMLFELSGQASIRAMDPEACDPRLESTRRMEPAYVDVVSLTRNLAVVCTAAGKFNERDISAELRAVAGDLSRASGLSVGTPVRTQSGAWIATVALPVRNEADAPVGFVAAAVDMGQFQDYVDQWSIPGAVVGVLARDGTTIARSGSQANIGTRVDSAATRMILTQRRGTGEAAGADGVTRLLSFVPIQGSGWTTVVSFDQKSVESAARRGAYQRLAYALAVTVGIGCIGFLFLRRITRPIAAVSSAIADVRAGHLSARAETKGPVEVHEFAKALNQMLDERLAVESKLREKSEQLRLFIRHAPAAIAMLDREMRYIAVSDRWRSDYGLDDADLAGRSHYEVFTDIPDSWKAIHRRCLAGAIERREEDAFVRADGRIEWIKWEILPWRDDLGEIGGLLLFSEVVTDRKLALDRIARLNRFYAMLSNINGLIVRVRGRQQLFNEATRIAAEYGGFGIVWVGMLNADSLAVQPISVAGEDAEWHLANLAALEPETLVTRQSLFHDCFVQQRATWSNDLRLDGPSSPTAYRTGLIERGYRSAIVLPLKQRDRVIGFMSLLSKDPDFFTLEEVKLAEEVAGDIAFAIDHLDTERRAVYLAFYDGLTGLANQSLFMEHVTHALHDAEGTGRSVVLLLADVRRFRLINETFGRHAGDDVLVQIAGRLRRSAHRPENLARVGPNTFAKIITDATHSSDIVRRVESLVSATLHEPLVIGESTLNVAFAAGVAIYPQDGADAETLFRNADAALLEAKSLGSNLQFFEAAMNEQVTGKLALESKLRKALELDQFTLFYQPKVRIADRALVGLEALIRWRDPDNGFMSPAKFIPLLEETGMIVDVGRWVLQRAAADWLAWRARGIEAPPIAVNVSSLQLRQRNFIDTVLETIRLLPSEHVPLHVEITESLIMEDLKNTVQKLLILRGLGIEVAIDDFGTGYSSLGYISSLPVDALKIDRSFIAGMQESEYSRTVVTMIVALSKTLHLRVIAEGVETEEEARFLASLGCEEMQGYLISRPLPPDQIEGWLAERLVAVQS